MVAVERPVPVSSDQLDVEISGLKERRHWHTLFLPGTEAVHVFATFATTLTIFGIFMLQGILVARVLGPIGRGEFGTAVFFPRDILLYVGLLGGIEIVNRYASRGICEKRLKQSAARLGMMSGLMTAVAAAVLSIVVLSFVDHGAKAYLIPYCLLVCLFVPWEHVHLTVSGVDRGQERYARYNFNRLIFAAAFPFLVLMLVITGLHEAAGSHLLLVICSLFVVSKIVGLLPTLRGISFRDWFRLPAQQNEESPVPSAKTLLRDGRPYALSMFATELFERLDILLILALASVQESGFYFVAVPAATLLTIAPNALGVFTFNAGAEGRRVTLKTALAFVSGTAVFQIVAMACLWLIIPWLIVLFYGEPFRPAIAFVWFLLPACAIKGFLQAVDGYLKGCGKPLIGVWARVISIFVMLVFVAVSYQEFGLLSIPMAAFVGQTVSMLIITGYAIRLVANQNPETVESV